MNTRRFLRRVAFVAALVITTVGIHAPVAHALPQDSCRHFLNTANEYFTEAIWWGNLGDVYANLGMKSQANDAYQQAHFYNELAQAYVELADADCP